MRKSKNSIKVALLGNSSVGKTCIITRYIKETFDEKSTSTIGANSIQKTLQRGKNEYTLNIWDTAGQEKYQSLGKYFYKDAYIIILVYDITSQESLESLKKRWYPDLQIYGENCVVTAVVGNKADLFENDDLSNEEEARDFANDIGAIFELGSAKNGTNIDKLFDNLLDRFLKDDIQEQVKEIEKNKKGNTSFDIAVVEDEKKKKCC